MHKKLAIFAVLALICVLVFLFQNLGFVEEHVSTSNIMPLMENDSWPMFRHDVYRTGNLKLMNETKLLEGILGRGGEYQVVWELMNSGDSEEEQVEDFEKKTGLDEDVYTMVRGELSMEVSTTGSGAPEGQSRQILSKDDTFDPSPIFVDLDGDGMEEFVTWYKNTAKEPGEITRRWTNKVLALRLGEPGEDMGLPGVFKRYPWLVYWEFVLPVEIHTSFAAADLDEDGYPEVVFGADDGRVYALDNSAKRYEDIPNPKAQVLWVYGTDGRVRSTPAIADTDNDGGKEVVFGSDDGYFYALNGKGELLWRYGVGDKIESSPAVYNGNIYFGSDDDHLYALSYGGELIWRYRTEGGVRSSPLVYDYDKDGEEEIIFGSDDKSLYILNLRGGEERIIETEGNVRSSPVVYRDYIAFGSADGNIYFVGEGIKKAELGSPVLGTPSSSDKYLIVMDTNATIHRIYEKENKFVKNVFKNFSDDNVTYLEVSMSLPIGNGFTGGTLIFEKENVLYPSLFISNLRLKGAGD